MTHQEEQRDMRVHVLEELIAQTQLDRGQPYWSERLEWLDHVEQWLNSLKDWGWQPTDIPRSTCLRCGLTNATVNHICIKPWKTSATRRFRWSR